MSAVRTRLAAALFAVAVSGFFAGVPRLDVPVFFVQGSHELTGRSRFADEWIAFLQAPAKHVYLFEHSGHNPDAEEPDRYNDLLIDTVLPDTYGFDTNGRR